MRPTDLVLVRAIFRLTEAIGYLAASVMVLVAALVLHWAGVL